MSEDLYSYRLSFAQERLWFLEQLQPGMLAHSLPGGISLSGPVKVHHLEEALNVVVSRHESLRTTFSTVGGAPRQIVAAEGSIHLSVTDISHLPAAVRRQEAMSRASETAQLPFDLVQGPLLRATLYRLDAEEHILTIVMHHIVTDGWSMRVFMADLKSAYADLCAERTPVLPDLPLQYPDYAEWQRDSLRGETLDPLISYWRDRLRGAPAVLQLPTDYPRPALETHRGGEFHFEVPLQVTRDALTLARREHATLFMVMLAAFAVLLNRYTGQTDILIGMPIAGRERQELEKLIGLFVNTLVLRIDLSGRPAFRELLRRGRETCLEAYDHQQMPFEKLVQEMRPERQLSQNPIFQVAFAFQNVPSTDISLQNVRATPLEFNRNVSQFDLTLYMWETESGVSGKLEYASDLFEPATIERMAAHLVNLVSSGVADPDCPIAELPMLTGAERSQLAAWNRTRAPYPRNTIHGLIEAQCRRTPDATAVMYEGRALTYEDLNGLGNQLARYLRNLEVGPDSLVGICIEPSLDLVVALLGILKAGAAYVPIDPSFPAERQAYMVGDAGISTLVTQASLAGRIAAPGTRVIAVDGDWPEIGRHPVDNLPDTADPGNLAYVIYTSGSTGKPKGVQIEHGAVVNFLESMRVQPGIGAEDCLLSVTTLSFDIAGLELYLPLSVGARVLLASRETVLEGRRLRDLLVSSGATMMQATPSTWQALLDSGWRSARGLKALCGGDAMSAKLAAELLAIGADVWNMYGPTETTIWSTIHRVALGEDPVPVGRPISNTTVYILDSNRQPVPVNVPGELYIGGEGLARGYFNRPELTSEKFVSDPFREGSRIYRTGDLARFRPDGAIEFLGRLDHQVKIRGRRIELGEIESVLSQCPGVKQAVVVVREEIPGDPRLVAYLTASKGRPPEIGEAREYLAKQLPDYMAPSAIVCLDAFPLTPNGKVNRRELPPVSRSSQTSEEFLAPGNHTEQRVAEIWQDILGARDIGVNDNFFDRGGHSLLLARLQAEFQKQFSREVSLVDLFQRPTVKTMAELIAGQAESGGLVQRMRERARQQRLAAQMR